MNNWGIKEKKNRESFEHNPPRPSNESYHAVTQTRGGADSEYETVSAPHTVPPPTSHSMEAIAGDSL